MPYPKGKKQSEESNRKRSEKLKGRISPRRGVKLSEEIKAKIKKNNCRYWLGKHHSEKTRKKISDFVKTQVGEKASNWKGGKPKCINCGKTISRQSISGMCIKCFGMAHRGEKNCNWKGDNSITSENKKIRYSIETRLWRESVFARDNWTCQKTGERGGRLISHHIQNFAQYPELRFAIDNGVTLSDKAHREFHKKYGFRKNTLEQLKEFINI